jgi:superfamily II DNA or RNA helicase
MVNETQKTQQGRTAETEGDSMPASAVLSEALPLEAMRACKPALWVLAQPPQQHDASLPWPSFRPWGTEAVLGEAAHSVRLELRPYQHACLTAIEAAALRGVRRQVVSLPTGAGKTVIFATLIAQQRPRTLILVHRDELVRQTLDKLTMVAQDTALDVGVVKAERDAHGAQIVVASVQTLAREQRLQRVARTFDLVIVDEAHHTLPDNSYGRILTHVRAFAEDGPLTLGFTATPYRPNNDPIISTSDTPGCFEEVVYTMPLMSLITQGYLSPILAKGIFLDALNLDTVRVRHGDYVEQDLADALMAADAPEHLVRGYQELAMGRRALIFCPTVAMTYAVAHAFTTAGLRAASVVGSTPPEIRQEVYQAIRAGRLHALVTCAVLTEGFDEPSIDCIMLARPTKSKVLFYQCIGRGLRLSPTTGKEDCLLIDAVGATKRHNMLSVAAELGLLIAKTPQDAPGDGEDQEGEGQEETEKATSYHAHDIDLTQRTRLHWVETPRKGYWVVSLAGRMLRVRPDSQGLYRLEVRQQEERRYTLLADHLTQEYCFGIASDTARDAQILHMVKEGAGWRAQSRTEKQEALARKLGIEIHPEWRKGDVADAITAVIGEWY